MIVVVFLLDKNKGVFIVITNSMLYEISLEIEKELNYERIYNRIVMLCDRIMKIDKFQFDLNQFSPKELKEFLKTFIIILDSKEDMVGIVSERKGNEKAPNKKLIHNLQKEDVDCALDYIVKRFIATGTDFSERTSFIPVIDLNKQEANNSLAEQQMEYAGFIRLNAGLDANDLISNVLRNYLNGFRGQVRDIKMRYEGKWLNLIEAQYVLYVALELFNYVFFQLINYYVIDAADISDEKKVDILNRLINKKPRKSKKEKRKQNIYLSFGTYLFYLEQRNRYATYSEIMDVLYSQMSGEDYVHEVDEKYQCNQRFVCDIGSKKELRNIILEGKTEKEERFNKNVEDCKYLMEYLRRAAGRHIYPEYLQHIKVVYREIIEDDLTYHGRQARTILRNLMSSNGKFDNEKDTYFIREKISRGFFREKGLSKLYMLRIEFQKQYYESVLSAFESYDVMDIAENLERVFKHYSKILMESR